MRSFQTVILLLIFSLTSFKSSAFPFKNQIFKESIHTVELKDESTQSTFPLIYLNRGAQLTLRFDDLADEVKDYSYTLIHCDDQWNQSDLFPNDYLTGFEEEQISTYDFSVNTTRNYIHYSISFPNSNIQINKSGNYILLVFENFDRNNVVFTQKFYVAETKVEITPLPTTPVDYDHRYTHQEIDFNVNYSLVNCDDPFNEISVVILQNNRYDNAINGLKPKFIRDKELLYNFDSENVFEGGNEYRVFDSRDLLNGGQGIEQILYIDTAQHIVLQQDEKRAYMQYSTQFDHNGNFYIGAKPYRSPYTEADYTQVHFRLPYPKELAEGVVYVNGAFSGNELNIQHRMFYQDSLQRYEADLLLKQGVYDYSYLYKPGNKQKANWVTLEGSHYQTENLYTIFVYYQSFSDNAKQLIGVKRFVYQ